MKPLHTLCCLLLLTATSYAQPTVPPQAVEPGVSLALATQRRNDISQLNYELHFQLPAEKSKAIAGTAAIRFQLANRPALLQLDFKAGDYQVKTIAVNGKNIPVQLKNEHLLIDGKYLVAVKNTIKIEFIAGNASLNRNDDYLYALLVPDRARTVFPCFDQPDLKATFDLTLTVPSPWKVLANGAKTDSLVKGNLTTYRFATTEQLPTYLFSFTAGKYTALHQNPGSRAMEFLHRETDLNKTTRSVDSIFIAHRDAIQFMEHWTGIKYPFQKVGFVAIPDYQFGGMEHPGEIQYKASSLFLGEGATKDQFISRSNLISHEIAHMWFGDLVTMKWFNDVWMKEVFANFMADKVTEKLMGSQTFNLKFLQDHYPAAYSVDRTRGANPIRQQLGNLQDAGSMYGNIIYHKAPIMMRQLEKLMGPEPFQKGIREYLNKYAYQNATWNDLIAILSKHTKDDLYEWNKTWVNQAGRPVFNYQVNYSGNKINKFIITQQAESGPSRVWPQSFTIKLVYPNFTKIIPVKIKGQSLDLASMKDLEKPLFIIFNADGTGYGRFPVDKAMIDSVYQLEIPLERAAAYINIYENTLSGQGYTPVELLRLFTEGLQKEQQEMNLRMLTGYISTLYWTFISPEQRLDYSTLLEERLWTTMKQRSQGNQKKILYNAFENIYLSKKAGQKLYSIWKTQEAPAGVKLIEDDYISLALMLSLKSDTTLTVIDQQIARTDNVDRKTRLLFLKPALSSRVEDRDAFFNRLSQRENRQKESWVGSALAYLHHPLRQYTSMKYLPKSLSLLTEIQKTGDIFFPTSWLSATFNSYQSKAAMDIVNEFLHQHPDYNPNLRGKILQSTDHLYRNQQLLRP
ncbi:aminopeptidase N [Pedobacter sp. CAN_A7]|uniref:M1 family metallopeptidase n=1 Tax=Pedobacter sp. CAN_A7 TaxID=2787722 RepID=UPI0018CAE84C